ncbi:hypothetical protein SKAU_G00184760 [Synaphobranchus kaupii]|uniref:G-protein coupled receptors family 1 profile domain-containing protein n=1 Tax=Synaphobranchus kaupii TaxID=118154 RepID=A0A9Q1FCI0_SYNKA|nr:hypothetical protein SKAU_G00184760 [Synaphobranchus kaupii]
MNESLETNETAAGVPWIEATDGNRSLELSTEPLDFPINPWDIMLCMSGTVIACENAIVVAIIFYTPTLRTPMFVLIGSLATADLLAGMGLILNFVFQYLISSETISLITWTFRDGIIQSAKSHNDFSVSVAYMKEGERIGSEV